MSFKPIDSRRDEFRKYLERSGVVDEITKVLIKLFNTPERPENAIEFIFENLGHTLLHKDQYEYLKKELDDSRNEIAELKRELELFKSVKQPIVFYPQVKSEPESPAESDDDLNQSDDANKSNPIQNGAQEDVKISSSVAETENSIAESVTSSKTEESKTEQIVNELNLKNENEKMEKPVEEVEAPTSTTTDAENLEIKNDEKVGKLENAQANSNAEAIAKSDSQPAVLEINPSENVQVVTSTLTQDSNNKESQENKPADEKK